MTFVLISCLTIVSVLVPSAEEFQQYAQAIPGNSGEPFSFTPVAGGTFLFGDKATGEITVPDFWISSHEITWQQYDAFVFNKEITAHLRSKDQLASLGIDGISGATAPYIDMSFGMGKDGYPAVGMTQYAALMYCKWLSASTGLFYRLPTEAEWEYACKMGKNQDRLNEQIVSSLNSEGKYSKVGSRDGDSLGLYDMLGNASEWTMDQYYEDYISRLEKTSNHWNRPDQLYPRTVRGGSWKEDPEMCSCTARVPSRSNWKIRDPQIPKSRWWHTNAPFVGFRIVRPRENPSPDEIRAYWLEPIDDYGN